MLVRILLAVLGMSAAWGGASRAPKPTPPPSPPPSPIAKPVALAPVDERAAAEELLAMELGGWRKVGPSDQCWRGKTFRYVIPQAFGGNTQDSGDPVVVLAAADPAPKILSIKPDPEDRSIRVVRFEILRKGKKAIREELSFVINEIDTETQGRVALMKQPNTLFYRADCQK